MSTEDAVCAQDAGADAIGIILVPGSPRYLGARLDEVEAIRRACGPFLTVVAVVQDIADIQAYPANLFDAVQYYESAQAHTLPPPKKRLLALRGAAITADDPKLDEVSGVVLDAYDAHMLGGTGRVADWSLAKQLVQQLPVPVILAGGLTPENVSDAVMTVRPYAVDVSSGVEREPGKKHPEKVRSFIQAVRLADEKLLGAAGKGLLP